MDYHSVFFNFSFDAGFIFLSPAVNSVLIFTILALYLISFILAGSEVAFFSLTPKDINLLKTKKQPSFRRIVKLMEQPKTLLASMLIANSFVNIGIILISNFLIDTWIDSLMFNSWILHFLLKVVVVTFFIVLFAEVMPKVWATHHKIWFASMSSIVVDFFNRFFYRLSKKFVGYSDSIEKRIAKSDTGVVDSSNLDYAIDLLPENEASIEEKQILKGIRKFSGTSVKQVMKARLDVSGISADLKLPEIIKQAEDLHYSRLPVYQKSLDTIIGVLHIKDLMPVLDQHADYDWLHLIRPAFFVHEKKLIEDLLQDFRSQRIHFAVVVDEFGGTSGIVTLEDIIEEITGEIKDEFDDEEIVNKQLDEYNFIFEGKTMIPDLCRTLKLPPSYFDKYRGDSDSLAGLVLEIAGAFPQANDTFVIDQYIFTPLEINKNRIGKVKVTINNPNQ